MTGLKPWQGAAIRAHANWPEGREISEDEFNAARDGALGQVIR